jgi:hypothetical protein
MSVTSINAVRLQRAVDEQSLKNVDEKIHELEKTLIYLCHQRRELVNRLGMNKGDGGDVA